MLWPASPCTEYIESRNVVKFISVYNSMGRHVVCAAPGLYNTTVDTLERGLDWRAVEKRMFLTSLPAWPVLTAVMECGECAANRQKTNEKNLKVFDM
jgi:hypothetical protein